MVAIYLRAEQHKSGHVAAPGRWVDTVLRMRFHVMLHGGFRVLGGVYVMAVGEVRVVSSLFMVARFVVRGGFLVMTRSVLVVFRCLLVVMCCFFRHGQPPGIGNRDSAAQCGLSEALLMAAVNAAQIADEYPCRFDGARGPERRTSRATDRLPKSHKLTVA
jgi:hypothetical protein